VLSEWRLVYNINHLAWPQRITLILLLIGAAINLYLAFQVWIERTWRRSYTYKGVICLLASIWYFFLVSGVIGPGQFIQVTRWLQPAIILGLIISGLQHLGERRQLKRRIELRGQLVEQAQRVIKADGEKDP
jgi:hypothetical protein